MSKKSREREVYDINKLISHIEKNSEEREPAIYNGEKMAIYGANINLKRFIADIKDGLIPVQRRLLMTMYNAKLYNNRVTKSAQVVGDVLKYFHPHGDSSAYGSLVYMGQSWRNNIAFVNTTANFGSAYKPDGYAHYRYTTAGLSEFAYDCYFKDWELSGNHKDDMTVDWIPTYDESNVEPMYLPAKYPVFLLMWGRQMGYGKYTSRIGFNLTEAFNAVIELIDNPDADIQLYPDDPMGCTLINKKDLRHIMDKPDLKARMRSTYEVSHYNGHDIIEITNTPFEVSPETVQAAIQKLAEKGELPEISDIDGCSTDFGEGFRISIEVKKGYDPDAVMTKLYKKTQLEETYTMKYAFVNGLESVEYTLRIAILDWLRYRRQTIKRMNKIKRVNILRRIHFLIPLIKVIESGEIDEFIRIVRKCKVDEIVPKLMKKFDLTDYQAEKISGVRISDLSLDKLKEYKTELAEISRKEEELAELTKSKKKINKIIIKELQEGIEKYGKPRKSKITQLIDSIQIPDTDHFLIFTNRYVKKLPYDERGYRIGRVDSNEKVLNVLTVNNRDRIAIFTRDGKCLPIDVNDIGNSGLQSVGISYTQLGAKDNSYAGVLKMDDLLLGSNIVSVTEKGLISKTPYDEIVDKKKVFAFMKLSKDDYMSGVYTCNKKDDLLVYTKLGNCGLFSTSDFETTSINTKGVQSVKLNDNDKVFGVISYNKAVELITLTDRGYVKRISITNLPTTKRAGKTIELNSTNGNLISVKAITKKTEGVYISTTAGVFVIDPLNIKAKSRLGKNERVVELKSSDYAFDLS